jgi:transposase
MRRRQCTAAFKAPGVLERLSGAKSSGELCREHQMASSVVAEWKALFLRRAASVFDSPESSHDQEAVRVAELERLVGRLTLENDILKKATPSLHQRPRPHER